MEEPTTTTKPRISAKDLYESYMALASLHRKTGQTVLEMLSHPDCTVAQMQDCHRVLSNVTKYLLDNKQRTMLAIEKTSTDSSMKHMMLTKIQNHRLFPKD
jgi:uncharacterized protein (DUF2236 family)